MASSAIRCGGNCTSFIDDHRSCFSDQVSKQIFRPDHFLSFRRHKSVSHQIYASSIRLSTDYSHHHRYSNSSDFYKKQNKVLFSERFDEWLRSTAVEIVKELNHSPLLVHVYEVDNGNGNGGSTKLKTEKTKLEDWPAVTAEWKGGEMRCPDGVIFVEELKNKEEEEGGLDQNAEVEKEGEENSNRIRVWGMVIQGRGGECAPACYLLKTSRVGAGGGLGLFCTHFCLTRVKNFRKSAWSQLVDCWLLQ